MPKLVAADIANVLRERIEQGTWSDAGRLPPGRDLAVQFGVARNTIASALSRLEREGLVVCEVGRGTFITGQDKNSFSGIMARIKGVSPSDMMEVRVLLEPEAAASAATHASGAQLDAVARAHEQVSGAAGMTDFEEWDATFHQRIFDCARNEFLKETHNIMRLLRMQPLWFEMKARAFSKVRAKVYCEEHGVILDALKCRDPHLARQSMREHLKTVSANLFDPA